MAALLDRDNGRRRRVNVSRENGPVEIFTISSYKHPPIGETAFPRRHLHLARGTGKNGHAHVLDDDPALAHTDVRVTPEEGKIVLRGRVNDQKTKTAIIEKATSEVKGWKIDDQISLDNR